MEIGKHQRRVSARQKYKIFLQEYSRGARLTKNILYRDSSQTHNLGRQTNPVFLSLRIERLP